MKTLLLAVACTAYVTRPLWEPLAWLLAIGTIAHTYYLQWCYLVANVTP